VTTEFATCHWHPDRRAGVICQRCDLPICPSCMHQASVGFHCPNCVAKGKQKVVSGRAAFGAGFQPVITLTLMAVNIGIFVIGQASNHDRVLIDYGIFGGSTEYYRLVTSGFLHSGLLHVALNMWALYNLGPTVERSLGRLRFSLVYAAALLAGAAGAVIASPNELTVGASGALYGLFAALVIIYRHHGLNVMRSGLGLSILLNVVFTLTIPNISIGGHAGGFVGGLIASWIALHGAKALKSNTAATVALAALVPLFFAVGVVAMNNT
jgi:membrane associated rhomboid family serine protease